MIDTLKAAWSDFRRSWRGLGFVFTAALLFVPAAGMYAATMFSFMREPFAIGPGGGPSFAPPAVGVYLSSAMVMLLAAPAYVLFAAGLARLSEEVVQWRQATLSDAWRGAIAVLPRVLGFYALVGACWLVVGGVYSGVFFGVMMPSTLSSGPAEPPVGFFFAFPLVFVFMIAASLLLTMVSSLGVRHSLIAAERPVASFAWALRTIDARKGYVIGFTMLLGAVAYAYETVLSAIAVPIFIGLAFASMTEASGPVAFPPTGLVVGMIAMYAVFAVGMLPFTYYAALAWTRFYHHLLEPGTEDAQPTEAAFADGPEAMRA